MHRKRRLLATLSLIAALLMMLSGCGFLSSPSPTPVPSPTAVEAGPSGIKPGPPYIIPVIVKTNTTTYWKLVGEGVLRAAADIRDAQVSFTGPDSEQNIDGQIALVEQQIATGAPVIVVAPSNPERLKPSLEKARAAGVAVILIDTDLDWTGKTSFIGTDNEKGGRLAGEYFATQFKPGDQVAIIRGALGDPTHSARQKGAEEAMKGAGLNVVTVQVGNSDRLKGRQVMTDILDANPNLKAVFCTNDEMALGASDAAKAEEREVSIVGFDANPEALLAVEAGQLTGSVAQFPIEIGRLGVENAVRVARGETIPERVDTGTELVTKENLARFKSEPQTGDSGRRTLSVLAVWSGSEREAFLKVLEAFTEKTGIRTEYRQSPPWLMELRSRITGEDPPMIAMVPSPGMLPSLAQERRISPLSDLGVSWDMFDWSYGPRWKDLGTIEGKLYGIVVKANSKSTIWYKPESFGALGVGVPTTWERLLSISDTYVEAGKTPWAVSGAEPWTLTDWFENIYARQAGPAKYRELFAGVTPFTDETVVQAIEVMTGVLSTDRYLAGGRQGALETDLDEAIRRVYGPSADAEMMLEGGFVGGVALNEVNWSLQPGKDIGFFPFPAVNPQYTNEVVVGGDLMVAVEDTPEVREFLRYMVSLEAAETWAATGMMISPHGLVEMSNYPNNLLKAEAGQVAGAGNLLFDGSDLLPGTLGDDWGNTLRKIIEAPKETKPLLQEFQAKAEREFGR